MPLILPDGLPAIELLKAEHIFVMGTEQAHRQSAKPLRIAILNLMPMKEVTETDLARVLSCSPLQLEIHLMKVGSHVSRHTSPEHMQTFYRNFGEMRGEMFDGFIITGAPLEHLDYEQVTYWEELTEIFDWSRTHATSTLYICWAAQAGLYHHYGVPKYPLRKKMFGIFPQRVLCPTLPIFRGCDDIFPMPHSRHTEVRREDILHRPDLTLIAESEESGVGMVMARGGREIFITGHSEYSPYTLDTEFKRDLSKGLPIEKPQHYYENDDPARPPVVTWRGHGTLLFTNWLHHYVKN